MELTVESDTYAPTLNDSGKYIDCMPRFGTNISGYYCPCGARKEKLYTSSSIMSAHMKTKTHQKWIELLNLNRQNQFVENIKLQETISQQRLIIAKLEKANAAKDMALLDKDRTISYLTKQLSYIEVKTVTDLLD
jgi:hypothetical protein